MRFAYFVGLLLVATVDASSVGPAERHWGPAVQKILEAGRLPDATAREAALRETLRGGLITFNRENSDAVFTFLSENSRWMDLRPFADVLEEFAGSDPNCRGIGLLDDNELARAPRDLRKQLYRQAIEKGAARLNHGSALTSASAMVLAAFEGIVELQPLVDQEAPLIEKRWRQSLEFNSIPALFELTSGARDRDDAADLAATRLAAARDDVFSARIESDQGFRAAVIRMTDYLCAINPFTGRSARGCGEIQGVVYRQTVLLRKRASLPSRSSPRIDDANAPDWLTRNAPTRPLNCRFRGVEH